MSGRQDFAGEPGPGAVLLRNSAIFLTLLLPYMLAGFWPSYFAKLGDVQARMHLHGGLMILWCVLLVSQSWLMRGGNRRAHRAFGQISYLLVPAIVLSTILMGRYGVGKSLPKIPLDVLYFLYVQLALLAFFALAYALAIANRRRPLVHARYMICTAMPMLDPIGARLLHNTLEVGFPEGQVITYGFTNAILLALAWWEWRRGTGSRVFLGMLGVLVLLQVPTFFLYKTAAWLDFAIWFGTLPLP